MDAAVFSSRLGHVGSLEVQHSSGVQAAPSSPPPVTQPLPFGSLPPALPRGCHLTHPPHSVPLPPALCDRQRSTHLGEHVAGGGAGGLIPVKGGPQPLQDEAGAVCRGSHTRVQPGGARSGSSKECRRGLRRPPSRRLGSPPTAMACCSAHRQASAWFPPPCPFPHAVGAAPRPLEFELPRATPRGGLVRPRDSQWPIGRVWEKDRGQTGGRAGPVDWRQMWRPCKAQGVGSRVA